MRKIVSSVLALVVLTSSLLIMPMQHANAAFNSNRIIDDNVFNDVSATTPQQIDTFLNTYPNSCISPARGFSAPDPIGYSPSTGYKFGGNVSAGNVIYNAAKAYDLNPRVVLVTLQKEQSLVGGQAGCSTLRYTGATGYGCPDGGTTYNYSGLNLYTINGNTVTSVSGTCVNSSAKAGFSQQVIRAAWLLKFGQQRSLGNYNWAIVRGDWDNSDDKTSCYSGPMTQGYRRICPSGSEAYYDGYRTIDGTSTHMDTGATAALYWYTPHFHGNQLFTSIWEGWFGEGTTRTSSFAWQNIGLKIMDEGKNAEIPTDSMHPGERLWVQVSALNTGGVTWYRDGTNPTRLGTWLERDHMTPYCDSSWPQCNRTPSLVEASVAPGQTGHFEFYMAVPNNAGDFREYFRPVLEYQSWIQNDTGFNIFVRDSQRYQWQWLYYDAWTDSSKTTPVNINDLAKGQQFYAEVHVKNKSATVWQNSGPNPTKLGTYNNYDRNSAFCTGTWLSCNRPAVMDQTTVKPGGEATFSFTMKAPNDTGEYREYFKPVLEYKGWTADDLNHMYFKVTH